MQSNLVEPSQLPELPAAGPFEHWLFEAPVLPAAALVILGLVAFIAMRRTKWNMGIGLPALLAGVVLGAGVYLLGSLTVTDREVLALRSADLVAAAGDGDANALSALLDERVRVRSVFASVSGRDAVVNLARTRAPRVIESAETRAVHAGLFGPQVARTQIRVRVQGEFVPSLSWWAVDWKRPTPDSDQWVATHIEPIWVQGFSDPAGTE